VAFSKYKNIKHETQEISFAVLGGAIFSFSASGSNQTNRDAVADLFC